MVLRREHLPGWRLSRRFMLRRLAPVSTELNEGPREGWLRLRGWRRPLADSSCACHACMSSSSLGPPPFASSRRRLRMMKATRTSSATKVATTDATMIGAMFAFWGLLEPVLGGGGGLVGVVLFPESAAMSAPAAAPTTAAIAAGGLAPCSVGVAGCWLSVSGAGDSCCRPDARLEREREGWCACDCGEEPAYACAGCCTCRATSYLTRGCARSCRTGRAAATHVLVLRARTTRVDNSYLAALER